ncbi:MAG: MATE family efflux transporter [Ruminococcaceae bacterium]|nr:MATE family efflux transporter [Oscillospiraceae bacterium]
MNQRRGGSLVATPAFYRKVARIALPICLQQLLNHGANLVDTLMVSYIGYVSAVTVASEINNLLFLFGFGINSAVSIYAAQFYGIRDWKNLKRAFGLFMVLNTGAALLFFLVAQLGRTGLLSFYSNDAELVSRAWEYLSIFSISFFFTAVTNGFSFMYRCIQKATVPMAIGIGVNISNACLNYVLIFGKLGLPAMGAKGAALASVIATGAGLAAHIIYAVATRQPFLGKVREMTDWPASFIRPMLRRMVPVMGNEMIFGLGDTMYIKAYGLLGTAALESYKVAYSISMIPYVVTLGVGNACSMIVGECLGRKDLQGAKDTIRYLLPLSALAGLVLSILLILMADPAVGLFNLSAAALRQSTVLMTRLFAIRIATRLFNFIFLSAIRAGGDSMFLLFLDCGLVWLVGLPIAYGSILLLGVTSLPLLYLLVQIEQLVRLVLGIWRYRSGKWLRNLTDEVEKRP